VGVSIKMLNVLITIGILGSVGNSEPLLPGQPGGPWNTEEIDIVRQKVIRMMDCQFEAVINGTDGLGCWAIEGLPEELRLDKEDDLGQYTQNINKTINPDAGPESVWDNQKEGQNNFKDKRNKFNQRGPRHSRLIQLAFHDCLRYEDGTGGCDGCINWSSMGYYAPNAIQTDDQPELLHAFPKVQHTNNNKLQMSARALELIYTVQDWPPGAPTLETSLKNSGKSRADLWQFAGNVALEFAINVTNSNCDDYDNDFNNLERQLRAIEGAENCHIKTAKPLPFRWGRTDCIPDSETKWTPYDFEGTKTEKHSNAYGTGTQVVKNLKADFDFTAAESISLMALHGIALFGSNAEEAMKYKWIGGSQKPFRSVAKDNQDGGSFSNIYFKILNGKVYDAMSKGDNKLFVGDINGDPINGTAWRLHCHKAWNSSATEIRGDFTGPCHFKASHLGCKRPDDNPDMELRETCFKLINGNWKKLNGIKGCKTAERFERDGMSFQRGGPLKYQNKTIPCMNQHQAFAMPYEVGFVIDFDIDEELIPKGCGQLDEKWCNNQPGCSEGNTDNADNVGNFQYPNPAAIYPGIPGVNGAPACERNSYAPEDEALADIVARFADNAKEWQSTFFNAWEKLQMNGYNVEDLTIAPENGNLQA